MKKPLMIYLLTVSSLINAQTALQDMKQSDFLPEANPDHKFDYQETEPQSFGSFEKAAQWADVVAIVQLENIDYQKTRELNAKGQAFLKVLVPYKGVKKNQLLIVNAKGFEDHVCYFPEKTTTEGQRYLTFLKTTQNIDEYTGFKPLCQMPILVTDTGQYALKYPLDVNIPIDDTIVEVMIFADPNATIDASDWTHLKREKVVKDQAMKLLEAEDTFQKRYYLTYQKGIMIYHIRELMNIPIKPRISSKQI